MSQQYGGIEQDEATVTIPDDNDVADSESVNVSLRSIKDSVRLSLSVASRSQIHHLVSLRSTDGAHVTVSAIPRYVQIIKAFSPFQFGFYQGAGQIFSAADLDIGPSFDPNRVYYCYLKWDGSTYKKVVSANVPDVTLAAQNADPNTTRYLGAFFTNGSGVINQLHKSGSSYTYEGNPGLGTVPGDGTIFDMNIATRIPAYCGKVRLFVEIYNTDPAAEDAILISSPGGPETLCPIGKGADVRQSAYLELPLRVPVVRARTLQSANKGSAVVRLMGMTEN